MRLRWALIVLIGAGGFWLPAPVLAQLSGGFSIGQDMGADISDPRLQLRTLNEERLYQQSAFGQRVEAEIIDASQLLEAENERLLEQLTARELELTEARQTMTPAAFRAAADEFDQQAQSIRREQAEKRQRLAQFEDFEQRRFFQQALPVLQDVLAASGGQVLIDARAVIIGVSGLDITEEAIRAMDAVIGDGSPSPMSLDLLR